MQKIVEIEILNRRCQLFIKLTKVYLELLKEFRFDKKLYYEFKLHYKKSINRLKQCNNLICSLKKLKILEENFEKEN